MPTTTSNLAPTSTPIVQPWPVSAMGFVSSARDLIAACVKAFVPSSQGMPMVRFQKSERQGCFRYESRILAASSQGAESWLMA